MKNFAVVLPSAQNYNYFKTQMFYYITVNLGSKSQLYLIIV